MRKAKWIPTSRCLPTIAGVVVSCRGGDGEIPPGRSSEIQLAAIGEMPSKPASGPLKFKLHCSRRWFRNADIPYSARSSIATRGWSSVFPPPAPVDRAAVVPREGCQLYAVSTRLPNQVQTESEAFFALPSFLLPYIGSSKTGSNEHVDKDAAFQFIQFHHFYRRKEKDNKI